MTIVVKFQTQGPLEQVSCDPLKLSRWRQGAQTPEAIVSVYGTVVVHRGTVYVSTNRRVFVFSVSEDKFTELEPSRYGFFCMAVVCGKLTAIGGEDNEGVGTNSFLSLSDSTSKWEELFPPMLTKRVCPAAVTTPNHLVVAGGRSSAGGDELHTVQSLRQDTGSPLKYIEFYLQPRLGLRHLYGS